MIKSASYGIIFILIDQISKWFILEQLDLDIIGSYDVYSPFLTLKMGWNTGCRGINNPYIFNLADIFVFTGLVFLLVFLEKFQK